LTTFFPHFIENDLNPHQVKIADIAGIFPAAQAASAVTEFESLHGHVSRNTQPQSASWHCAGTDRSARVSRSKASSAIVGDWMGARAGLVIGSVLRLGTVVWVARSLFARSVASTS
jgi:hypothetical protein